ncbi:hypothetical protein B0H21DRAFT_820408 [Amylocystis lapponica]|nr:hypothetical protein B0H21DRAFT_820408 [Amylocystis lapponica]
MAKVLEIRHTDWRTFPSHPGTRFHRTMFSSVRELTLTTCQFGSFNEFIRLISAFPSLSTLRLDRVTYDNEGPTRTFYCSSWPALRSFFVSVDRGKEMDAMLEWMSLDQRSHSLRHLCLTSDSLSAAVIGRVAPSFGFDRLESLSLQSRLTDSYELLFTACSALLSLRVQMYENGILEKLAGLLSLLTSRSIRSLELTVSSVVNTEAMLSEQLSLWTQADDVLAREQFASLKTVDVTWFLAWSSEQEMLAPPVLADRFTKLCARGIFDSRVLLM